MAKKESNLDQSAVLLERVQRHVEKLWGETEKKFFDALDDSERRTIKLNFGVTLDLSESAPVVDTEISFKDKCKESGMDVNKTFRKSVTDELDDPAQPGLPGMADGGEGEGAAPEGESPAPKKKRSKKADVEA